MLLGDKVIAGFTFTLDHCDYNLTALHNAFGYYLYLFFVRQHQFASINKGDSAWTNFDLSDPVRRPSIRVRLHELPARHVPREKAVKYVTYRLLHAPFMDLGVAYRNKTKWPKQSRWYACLWAAEYIYADMFFRYWGVP